MEGGEGGKRMARSTCSPNEIRIIRIRSGSGSDRAGERACTQAFCWIVCFSFVTYPPIHAHRPDNDPGQHNVKDTLIGTHTWYYGGQAARPAPGCPWKRLGGGAFPSDVSGVRRRSVESPSPHPMVLCPRRLQVSVRSPQPGRGGQPSIFSPTLQPVQPPSAMDNGSRNPKEFR